MQTHLLISSGKIRISIPPFNSCQYVAFQIYGWIPEYYNDIDNLPSEMPQNLVSYIRSVDASWVS